MTCSTSTSSNSSGNKSCSRQSVNPCEAAIAQASLGMANATYAWANNAYAQNSAITNQTVQCYFKTSAAALSQAQKCTAAYNNTFVPQEQNLVADANSYASTPRIQMQMGAAEAQNAQAFQSQRDAATQTLQSYGIDPSSGMYGELNDTLASQQAAAGAGAAQQAEQATEATGRALRSEAIQVGERMPQNITNSENTALAANAGAENATLANTNTGATALGTAANFVKFPPLATASNSVGSSSGTSNSTSKPSCASNNNQNSQANLNNAKASQLAGGSCKPPTYSCCKMPTCNMGGRQGCVGSCVGGCSGAGCAAGGPIGDAYFASGGAIPCAIPLAPHPGHQHIGGFPVINRAAGGAIPAAASPSAGAKTDDVNVHANVGEFMIPKDVTAWKGQEYFQKLIAGSRKARATGTVAQGSTAPAAGGA